MVAAVPERVVVLGASAAGLLAAAALAAPGREITVLERDDDPGGPDADGRVSARPGVPQARQPHVFLHRGLLEAEKLLPGLREDLVRRGGVPFDTASLPWRTDQGWMPTDGQAYEVVSVSRALLDDVLRSRVARLPGVALRWGDRTEGLARTPIGAWQVRVAHGLLDADLVVDATGRASRLPLGLRDGGMGGGRRDGAGAGRGYAPGVFAGGSAAPRARGIVLLPPPADPVGGLALQVEDGRWL